MKKILAEIISSFRTHDLKTDAISFSMQVGAMLLNLLTNLLLARIMLPQDFGAFAYSSTLIFVLAGIGTFGTQNLLVREAGAASNTEKLSLTKSLFTWAIRRSILYTLILVAAFIFISFQFNLFFREENLVSFTTPILLSLISVPLLVITLVNQSYLQGHRKILSALFAEKIAKPFLVLTGAGVLFLILQKQPLNFTSTALINVSSFLIALIVISYSVIKNNKTVAPVSPDAEIVSTWRKSSLTFFLFNVVTLLYLRVDILSLGFFSTPEKIGVYNVSCRVADTVSFPLHILTFGLAPLISQLFASGEKIKLQKTITASTRIIFLLSAIPAMVFIILGTPILSLFGKHFEDGQHSLIILLCANLINALAGPAGYVLVMTGHERQAFYSMSLACLLSIILNAILIPAYGISGAAIAVFFAMISWNILISVYTYSKTGIRSDIFFLFKRNEV